MTVGIMASRIVYAETFSNIFSNGWHLISVPCAVEGLEPGVFFAPVSSDVVGFSGGQLKPSNELPSMTNGKGYWAYFDGDTNVSVDCISYASDTVTLALDQGWNIIGIPFSSAHWAGSTMDGVSVGVSSMVEGPPYQYDATSGNYSPNSIMTEWNGYAVKVTAAGSLQIPKMSVNNTPAANAGDDYKWFVGSIYDYAGYTGTGNELNTIFARRDIPSTLDGRSSSDPDGDILTYTWRQTAGPAVSIADSNASTTTFIPGDASTYQFELTVSDGFLAATDTVTVTTKKLTGKLVFSLQNGATEDIYTLDLEDDTGAGLKRITDHYSGYEKIPRWSTDGVKILYAGTPPEEDPEIYLMNQDGSGKTQITDNYSNEYSGDISGSGRIIYCSDKDGPGDLYDVNISGTDERRLTNLLKDCTIPKYSPDDSMIVFLTNYGGDNDEIYVINADGTNLNRLTNDNLIQLQPNWTPDGKIIFCERELIYTPDKVYTMLPDGTQKTLINTPVKYDRIYVPVMTGDGEFIYFEDDNSKLIVMYSDGSSSVDLGFGGLGTFDYYPVP